MNLATRLFAADAELDAAETQLLLALTAILGPVDWQRITVDPSDMSFEAFSFTPFDIEIAPEQLLKIGNLGFGRFWIHPGDDLGRETERSFWCERQRPLSTGYVAIHSNDEEFTGGSV